MSEVYECSEARCAWCKAALISRGMVRGRAGVSDAVLRTSLIIRGRGTSSQGRPSAHGVLMEAMGAKRRSEGYAPNIAISSKS